MVLMYLVYGSTEYSKQIHAVIGTNVLSVWVYRIQQGDKCCNWY